MTRGKVRVIFYTIILGGVLILMSGCLSLFTGRPALKLEGNPIQRATEGDFRASLQFMDDETLDVKYERQSNPFLSDYYAAQFKRIMVFELTLENRGDNTAQFFLNRVELAYGGKTITPHNRFRLEDYWKFKDEPGSTNTMYSSDRGMIIEKTVLPNSYTLGPNGVMKGYLVFLGNTPAHGEALVYVPINRTKDEEMELFTFTYRF